MQVLMHNELNRVYGGSLASFAVKFPVGLGFAAVAMIVGELASYSNLHCDGHGVVLPTTQNDYAHISKNQSDAGWSYREYGHSTINYVLGAVLFAGLIA